MRTVWLPALLALLSAAAARGDELPAAEGIWFVPKGPPSAVALVVHGLNLRPQRMDALAEALSQSGIEVFRLALSGHDGGKLSEASAARWMAETVAGYRAVAQAADRFGVPRYLVGYSLGGLLGEALLAGGHGSVRFDRAVLLAPAIALRPAAYLVKASFPFGSLFALPSANTPFYRAHARTPMAAYRALFELLDRARRGGYRNADLPTLVIVRSGDELVSPKGIEALVRSHRLARWSIRLLSGASPRGYPHHLIIDPTTAGAAEWAEITRMILEHFRPQPGPEDAR